MGILKTIGATIGSFFLVLIGFITLPFSFFLGSVTGNPVFLIIGLILTIVFIGTGVGLSVWAKKGQKLNS